MLIDELKTIVGPQGWTADPRELEPHLTEWRGAVRGDTALMVTPATTSEVAAVVTACSRAGTAIVPQGGNTGLCAGAVPDGSGRQVLLNLSRMNSVREIDPADFSMTVDAGCVLADIQRVAKDNHRYFPLSLAAEGSCQIGGNLSTNAGGLNVIRYGTARRLVLGLEVVLADGAVWDGLGTLRKDTAGYDVKQLFIGSEGTLGIITAASLRLFPAPGETGTALLAVANAADAVRVLGELRVALGDRIEAFELIADVAVRLVEKHIPGVALPFDQRSPWYVLVEASSGAISNGFENALMECIESGSASDIVVAKNQAESESLWRMRHGISEAQKREGANVKHDISVPIGRLHEFLARGEAALVDRFPDTTLIAFGHLGDGNLHYNVSLPTELTGAAREQCAREVSALVYDLVAELGGSFSAEHGVGVLKKGFLERYGNPVEIELMRTLKKALDPANILNPGKVI